MRGTLYSQDSLIQLLSFLCCGSSSYLYSTQSARSLIHPLVQPATLPTWIWSASLAPPTVPTALNDIQAHHRPPDNNGLFRAARAA